MNNKKLQRTIAFIAIAVLFYFAKSALPTTEGLFEPDYTTFSTANEGTALLYDTLKIMGYPVARDTMFIDKDRPVDNVQIIIQPGYSYRSEKHYDDIRSWVARGGTLLYFESGYGDYFFSPGNNNDFEMIEQTDAGNLYQLGLGKIFIGKAQHFTNIVLIEGGDIHAQQIANMLNNVSSNKIYFNEAYHGYGTEKGLFESLPPGIRILGFQLILVAIAMAVYFGKRFGRVIPYYEEIEREENEYVFTLTNLYMSIGLGSAAIDVYDKKFKKICGSYFRSSDTLEFSEILPLWKSENLPETDKLDYVSNAQNEPVNTKRAKERREFLKIISYYKELIYIVSKL